MRQLGYREIVSAADRIQGRIRPVVLSRLDQGAVSLPEGQGPGAKEPEIWLALEFLQHTGSFKARGAVNFLRAHREAGTLPEAGLTIASGGNAGLACAWAARAEGTRATVFVPATSPGVKVARLRAYGAEVHLVDGEYADAARACAAFAERSGALAGHAYDNPFMAAGAGTLVDEILAQVPGLDTVIVAVGGGGLFAGVATAAHHHGVRTVGVEPERSQAFHAALRAGEPVDVPVGGVAADALGARRVTGLALAAARAGDTVSVLVPDDAIMATRRALWDHSRMVTEPSGATALASLALAGTGGGGYAPSPGERIAVVLCGANTDPSDLVRPSAD
ncbi:serine/threonine dehydratase [Streptomyces sp. NPDC057638]|uniref:serine/threonine dehydratase n=1 Tax=Streptomyces sp. NPDC057638 TaxID=3346190 RepID=UPI0036A79DCE